MSRTIAWFSCGSASAVAAKLALEKYDNVEIVRIIVRDEDPGNSRFADDCEEWFGQPIVNLINEEFDGSVDAVIKKRRYMGGVGGSPCTEQLKKEVRKQYQQEGDAHVFGFHIGEEHREDQVLDAEPTLEILTPLIDDELTKDDCHRIIAEAGIDRPRMYDLGFPNANCRGCVKAVSAGYWNLTRIHHPDTFKIRSEQERMTGARMWKMSAKKYQRLFPEYWERMNRDEPDCFMIDKRGTLRLPLRYLPPEHGLDHIEATPDCGILCELKNEPQIDWVDES